MRSLASIIACTCTAVFWFVPLSMVGQSVAPLPQPRAASPIVVKAGSFSGKQKSETRPVAKQTEQQNNLIGTKKQSKQPEDIAKKTAPPSEQHGDRANGAKVARKAIYRGGKNSKKIYSKEDRKGKIDRVVSKHNNRERGKRRALRQQDSKSAHARFASSRQQFSPEEKRKKIAEQRTRALAEYRKKREQQVQKVRAETERRRIAARARKEERMRQIQARKLEIAQRKQRPIDG